MVILVRAGHLSAKRAWATGQRIAASNPYIIKDILGRFKEQIGA